MSQSQTDFPKDQTIDPNSTVQTEEEYDLEPLKSLNIGHRIHWYMLNPKWDEIKKALTLLPTLRPFYKIANNQNIRQRRDEALRIAAVGLKHSSLGSIYSQGYIQLNYALLQLQQAAKSSFRLTGKRLPDLPYWGDFGEEHFLTRLADIHDFKTNKLRNNSELAEEHIRLFGEIVEAANQDIPLPMESISNAVLFNFGKNVAEAPDPGNDLSSNEDNSKDERPSRSHPRLKRQILVATSIGAGWSEEQFDKRFKQDTIPTWDSDTNTIVCWIKRVNDLAKKSWKLCKQLGSIVPRRLEGSAQYWYYSLPLSHCDHLETDWELLRDEIAAYYMNRCWMETMRQKANCVSYREAGHPQETPNSEIISEIMEGAPANWSTILLTKDYDTVLDFQTAIKFYEDSLLELELMITIVLIIRNTSITVLILSEFVLTSHCQYSLGMIPISLKEEHQKIRELVQFVIAVVTCIGIMSVSTASRKWLVHVYVKPQ
ncbi:hypothetical protein C8R41DRAFT_872277 [Lentinula lateritia]|uniref:Uncharacterized protein n=1 Tax=Lentinula lateritia TaxID=40482 RepID=A0ABQ8UWJ9_9AGAR|nr:hypothetical protein C8R41DRAFT_872277 [Lentinula lateritia]